MTLVRDADPQHQEASNAEHPRRLRPASVPAKAAGGQAPASDCLLIQYPYTFTPRLTPRLTPRHRITSAPHHIITSSPPHLITSYSQHLINSSQCHITISPPHHPMTSTPHHLHTSSTQHLITTTSGLNHLITALFASRPCREVSIHYYAPRPWARTAPPPSSTPCSRWDQLHSVQVYPYTHAAFCSPAIHLLPFPLNLTVLRVYGISVGRTCVNMLATYRMPN